MNNTQFGWDYVKINNNLKSYLIPWVEANYNVSTEVADRAFCGLSMGGMTTSTLYFYDPLYFGYFGIFSGSNAAAFPEMDDYTAFKGTNVYLAAGWADMALENGMGGRSSVDLAVKLDEQGITYNDGEGIYLVQGGHDWFVWPQIVKHYVETTLWK